MVSGAPLPQPIPPAQLRLIRLDLTNFRSYASLTWRPASRMVAIFGPNGSGKTNLLEAVSLLVPGRGLRGARISELVRRGEDNLAWAVAARFTTPLAETEIGTGTPPEGPSERRVFRLDGAAPRNQAEIAGRIAAVWLTPQMDRLFLEGASGRRRFLDRLVFALEPGHAREIAAHETAMANRNRLLVEARTDPGWLAALEDQMARHSVAATVARATLIARLNTAMLTAGAANFPAARISLACPIADRLASTPALESEDWLRRGLAANRSRDSAAGASSLGAHRADMALADAASGLPAGQASTGQQKALLIGTILAHATVIEQARGFAPLLLLDEPAVHLDPARRAALFDALSHLRAQVLLTGTDAETFLTLAETAEGLQAGNGELRADPRFRPS